MAGCFFICRIMTVKNTFRIQVRGFQKMTVSWLIVLIWTGSSCLVMDRQSIAGLAAWVVLSLFLFLPYCQDLLTFTFDWKIWGIYLAVFGLCFFFLNPMSFSSGMAGVLPAFLMIPFILCYAMGSADFVFMLVFGFLLGFERATVCLVLGILLGLLYAVLIVLFKVKCRLIPFVSALSLAFLIAFYRGYSIWFFLLKLFTF